MKDFNELLNRSYDAIKGRGLITDETLSIEFLDKMKEELNECYNAFMHGTKKDLVEETTDLMTVCCMFIKHLGLNPIDEFEKVVLKNETRAKIKIK